MYEILIILNNIIMF